jgi:glutamyl-tRNA reductase
MPPGVRLYDIDDLRTIVQANVAVRKRTRSRCETIIQRQVDHLLRQQGGFREKKEERQDALEQRLVVSGAGW